MSSSSPRFPVKRARTSGDDAFSVQTTLDAFIDAAREERLRRTSRFPFFLQRAVAATSRLLARTEPRNLSAAVGSSSLRSRVGCDSVTAMEHDWTSRRYATCEPDSMTYVAPCPLLQTAVRIPLAHSPNVNVATAGSSASRHSTTTDSQYIIPSASSTSSVVDVVFDETDEFALVLHKKMIKAYRVKDWMDRVRGRRSVNPIDADDSDELLAIQLREHQQSFLGYGFRSAQFLQASLSFMTVYKRNPVIDVFDLEQVDVLTSLPQHRLPLDRIEGSSSGGSSSTTPPCADDVTAVSAHVALAALTNGITVWADTRTRHPTLCTGGLSRSYTLGSSNGIAPALSSASHLTSLGLLPIGMSNSSISTTCATSSDAKGRFRGGDGSAAAYLVTGSKEGLVRLWDTRMTGQGCLAQMAMGSEIGRVHPCNSDPRSFWINTISGRVARILAGIPASASPSGSKGGLSVVASYYTNDGTRSDRTFNHETPRIAIMEPAGLVFCPHVNTSSLLVIDGTTIQKRTSRPHESSELYSAAMGACAFRGMFPNENLGLEITSTSTSTSTSSESSDSDSDESSESSDGDKTATTENDDGGDSSNLEAFRKCLRREGVDTDSSEEENESASYPRRVKGAKRTQLSLAREFIQADRLRQGKSSATAASMVTTMARTPLEDGEEDEPLNPLNLVNLIPIGKSGSGSGDVEIVGRSITSCSILRSYSRVVVGHGDGRVGIL